MTNKRILFFLCLLCFGACASSKPENVDEIVVIDIDKALRNQGKLTLSDFADSVSFVPIYDDKGAVIGEASRIAMTENHLLVYDMTGRLVCYDLKERKGTQIGVRGRGPREYLGMGAIALDEADELIYALVSTVPGSAIHKYDFEGKLLDIFPLEDGADKIGLTDQGHIVVHLTNYSGNSKNQYIVLDNNGETITEYPNPFLYNLPGQRRTFAGESAVYSYRGEFHIKDKSDTLYVFRGKERYPKYVFKNSFSIDGKKNLSTAEYDLAFVLNYVFETDTKLIFNGYLGGFEHDKWRYFYYGKTNGQTYSIENNVFSNDQTAGFPGAIVQATSDAAVNDCYVKIIPNTHSEMAGYPKDENASYFLMLLHLK